MQFLNSVHCVIFQKQHNVLYIGSVSVLRWNGMEQWGQFVLMNVCEPFVHHVFTRQQKLMQFRLFRTVTVYSGILKVLLTASCHTGMTSVGTGLGNCCSCWTVAMYFRAGWHTVQLASWVPYWCTCCVPWTILQAGCCTGTLLTLHHIHIFTCSTFILFSEYLIIPKTI
jgi:hypothetical protein